MPLAEVDFFDLRYDHRHKSPVLFLKDALREKYLPVWIGELEASSIENAVVQKSPPRPMTHDLLVSSIHGLGGRLIKVIIDRLEKRTYYATLVIETRSGQQIEVDSRPSDAIALALRENARMFVEDDLMYSIKFVEISEGDEDDDESDVEGEAMDYETFQDFLKNATPTDFRDG
ncbi:bifunctional nuclease family protein [bacterium]|nr:bifunctional nuclease family protein [bacterium]